MQTGEANILNCCFYFLNASSSAATLPFDDDYGTRGNFSCLAMPKDSFFSIVGLWFHLSFRFFSTSSSIVHLVLLSVFRGRSCTANSKISVGVRCCCYAFPIQICTDSIVWCLQREAFIFTLYCSINSLTVVWIVCVGETEGHHIVVLVILNRRRFFGPLSQTEFESPATSKLYEHPWCIGNTLYRMNLKLFCPSS